MNLSAFTVKDIQELRETAKRMGYNRLANRYLYELMRAGQSARRPRHDGADTQVACQGPQDSLRSLSRGRTIPGTSRVRGRVVLEGVFSKRLQMVEGLRPGFVSAFLWLLLWPAFWLTVYVFEAPITQVLYVVGAFLEKRGIA